MELVLKRKTIKNMKGPSSQNIRQGQTTYSYDWIYQNWHIQVDCWVPVDWVIFYQDSRAHPWSQLNIVACPRKSTYGSGLLLLYFFFFFFHCPSVSFLVLLLSHVWYLFLFVPENHKYKFMAFWHCFKDCGFCQIVCRYRAMMSLRMAHLLSSRRPMSIDVSLCVIAYYTLAPVCAMLVGLNCHWGVTPFSLNATDTLWCVKRNKKKVVLSVRVYLGFHCASWKHNRKQQRLCVNRVWRQKVQETRKERKEVEVTDSRQYSWDELRKRTMHHDQKAQGFT